MIKRNGGSISGDNITIVCQTPVPVRFEQAFEGMFPIGRQEIRKELRHLGSFTFEGTGIVFTGYIRGAKNYVAQVEMYVDGKIIERAVLPTGKKSSCRPVLEISVARRKTYRYIQMAESRFQCSNPL